MFIGELSPAGRREAVAPANFVDLARQSRAFERMAMHRGARFILTGRSVPESVIGANVSSTFFSVLRVQPQQGRAFLPQDEQPGGVRAAMLSHTGWVRQFSQDPAIVGRTITLDGVDHTVVGVLPPGFSLLDTDIWVAGFDPALLNSRVAHNMGAIGRLADGSLVRSGASGTGHHRPPAGRWRIPPRMRAGRSAPCHCRKPGSARIARHR